MVAVLKLKANGLASFALPLSSAASAGAARPPPSARVELRSNSRRFRWVFIDEASRESGVRIGLRLLRRGQREANLVAAILVRVLLGGQRQQLQPVEAGPAHVEPLAQVQRRQRPLLRGR